MLTLYLAGPGIFAPDAQAAGARKQALCRDYGFIGLYPLDQALPEDVPPAETALAIYRADVAMMEQADAIVADLSPFRGPSADPGTVFELAWMLARGRPAFAYSTDPRPLRGRIPGVSRDPATNRWTAPDGDEVEDFGLPDNLMIACALLDAGVPLITPEPGSKPGPLWGLERCLAAARTRFAQPSEASTPPLA